MINVSSITDTPFTEGAIGYSRFMIYLGITQVLTLPLGGYLSDRIGNIRIIKWGSLLALILCIVDLVLLASKMNHQTILYAVNIGFAIVWVLIIPGLYSSIPKLVQNEQLLRANSVVDFVQQLVLLAVPGFALKLFYTQSALVYLGVVLFTALILSVVIFLIERKSSQDEWFSSNSSNIKNSGEKTQNALQIILLLLAALVVNLPVTGLRQLIVPLIFQQNIIETSFDVPTLLFSLLGIGTLLGVILSFGVNFKTIYLSN